jgi:hypothetical protein
MDLRTGVIAVLLTSGLTVACASPTDAPTAPTDVDRNNSVGSSRVVPSDRRLRRRRPPGVVTRRKHSLRSGNARARSSSIVRALLQELVWRDSFGRTNPSRSSFRRRVSI